MEAWWHRYLWVKKKTVLFREPFGDKYPRRKCSLGCREDLGKAGTFRGWLEVWVRGKKAHMQALVCTPKLTFALKLVCGLVYLLFCAPKFVCFLICALICAPNIVCALAYAQKLICALVYAQKIIFALVCAPKNTLNLDMLKKILCPRPPPFLLTSKYFHWIGPLGQFSL